MTFDVEMPHPPTNRACQRCGGRGSVMVTWYTADDFETPFATLCGPCHLAAPDIPEMPATAAGPRIGSSFPPTPATCFVCGSTATLTRTPPAGLARAFCHAHAAVCWPHLADPCPTCDDVD